MNHECFSKENILQLLSNPTFTNNNFENSNLEVVVVRNTDKYHTNSQDPEPSQKFSCAKKPLDPKKPF